MTKNSRWTEEETAKLRYMIHNGDKLELIQAKLGRFSISQIKNKLANEGLKKPAAKRVEEILESSGPSEEASKKQKLKHVSSLRSDCSDDPVIAHYIDVGMFTHVIAEKFFSVIYRPVEGVRLELIKEMEDGFLFKTSTSEIPDLLLAELGYTISGLKKDVAKLFSQNEPYTFHYKSPEHVKLAVGTTECIQTYGGFVAFRCCRKFSVEKTFSIDRINEMKSNKNL